MNKTTVVGTFGISITVLIAFIGGATLFNTYSSKQDSLLANYATQIDLLNLKIIELQNQTSDLSQQLKISEYTAEIARLKELLDALNNTSPPNTNIYIIQSNGSIVTPSASPTSSPNPAPQEWLIEDSGGNSYSVIDNSLRVTSSFHKSITFYQQISPNSSFTYSLKVKAVIPAGFAIMVRNSLPFANSVDGFNFEFANREYLTFLFSRCSHTWTWNYFAPPAQVNAWYNMSLTVQKAPFKVTAEVHYENGTFVGSYSTSDMSNTTFDSIKYIGFTVWESGEYFVKDY